MNKDFGLGNVLACVGQRWSPHIGDPNVTGWLTVLAYLLTALMAFLVWRRRRDLPRRVRALWLLMMVACVLLAVNKQLDLQSALTAFGRCIAQLQGWYEERRSFQRHVIMGFLAVAGAMAVLTVYLMRKHLVQNGVALMGLGLVCTFVAVRAVGIHHVDALISMPIGGVRANFLLETAGLVLIVLNAGVLLRGRATGGAD